MSSDNSENIAEVAAEPSYESPDASPGVDETLADAAAAVDDTPSTL